MPILRSASRPQPAQCFFCLSSALLQPRTRDSPSSTSDAKGKHRLIAEPGTKWNWQCERCGCWNIRDASGEMISDLPAMHNPTYNSQAFSLRARPSRAHLPTASTSTATSPFCRSCLANQTLIINMLANYLPEEDDPSYQSLCQNLPGYLSSLHSRYPPVCPNCQPAVDDALRRADQKGQAEAWGSALARGRQVKQELELEEADWRVSSWDVFVWRARGGLWWVGTALSWVQGIFACYSSHDLQTVLATSHARYFNKSIGSLCLFFHLISILWIAWDPYWLQRVRSRDRRRVKGRGAWVRNMLVILMLRIIVSAFLWTGSRSERVTLSVTAVLFFIEIALSLHALSSIRTTEPVAIKLVRPVSLVPPAPLPTTPSQSSVPSDLTSLSLSSNPITSHQAPNPIFGQPSLLYPMEEAGPEPMDWEPTPSVSKSGFTRPSGWLHDDQTPTKSDWDNFATNKQRLFPQTSQAETGLENLLAGWGIGGGGSEGLTSGQSVQSVRQENVTRPKTPRVENVVQAVAFTLVILRLLGMGAASVFVAHPPFVSLSTLNTALLSLEVIITLSRIYIVLRSHYPLSLLALGLAIFDGVLRAMVLAEHGFIDVLLDKVGDERSRCFEWLFWGFLDLVGLSV